MKPKKLLAILLVAVMMLSFAACGKKEESDKKEETPGSEISYGGVLRMHTPSYPAALNSNVKSVGRGYIAGVVETLGRKNIATNEITPQLAESWKLDTTTNTVLVKLRKDVTFHDGSLFNAEVVKWNNDLCKENQRLSTAHNFSTEIVDEFTVKIIFDKFYLDWEESALATVYMYSKKSFDDNGLDYILSTPVGTGPFKFVEYVPNQKVVYTKYDEYWQKDKNGNPLPYLDGYEAVCITDQNAAMTAFLTGEIDHLCATDDVVIQQLEASGYKNKCIAVPASTTTFEVYANNKLKDSPWANLDVRKAVFLYGIDYEDLTKLAGGLTATCTHNINLPGSLLEDATIDAEYKYDLEKAKKMLADAGYPNGFKTGLETTAIGVPCATVLQEKLKALGIEAEITKVGGGDARRYDPSIEGIAVHATTTNWDTVMRPLGSMHSPVDLAGAKTQGPVMRVDFSQAYREFFEKAFAAKTNEERAEWGRKAVRQLYIEDVNSTLCYVKASGQFINDKVHDTDFEYNWSTPTFAWKEQ